MRFLDHRILKGATGLILVGGMLFVACSGDDEPQSSLPESTLATEIEPSSDSSSQAQSGVADDVSASGVVLAATLIAGGKIDEAVASGLVTPAEVDEARAAIEGGTLNEWVERAENE